MLSMGNFTVCNYLPVSFANVIADKEAYSAVIMISYRVLGK